MLLLLLLEHVSLISAGLLLFFLHNGSPQKLTSSSHEISEAVYMFNNSVALHYKCPHQRFAFIQSV